MLKKLSIASGLTTAGLASALALIVSPPTHAITIIFDQIGNGAPTDNGGSFVNQDFEPVFDSFDGAIVDDFEINNPVKLLGVDAVFVDNSNILSNATQWNVGIFSSPTAASTSLIGDVAHAFVDPNDVNISTGFNNSGEVLVEIPISLPLADADTYWVGIYPTLDFDPFGQVFVSLSSLANDTSDNAVFANPGNGFGSGTLANCLALSASPCNVAYRLQAVPELKPVPEPASILGLLAIGAIGSTSLKRRQKEEK